MTDAVKVMQTEALLEACYQSVKAAEEAILSLMPRVRDEALKSDMTVALSAYEAFASRAAKLLAEEGVTPREDGILCKMSQKWNALRDTVRDHSSSHIAELMIKRESEGMSELQRALREAENSSASESALRLARDVCRFEEKNAQDMKKHIR